MTEKQLQKKALKYLKTISYVFKVVVANEKGVVDIHGCKNGKYYCIELKGSDKTEEDVSFLQNKHLQKVRDNGGLAFWSNNFEEIKEKIDKL